VKTCDRSFWAAFLSIAIIGTITWLAMFEHNYHPRIYRYSEDVTILQVGDSELDFNHPEVGFSIRWQSGRRNVRVSPRRGITGDTILGKKKPELTFWTEEKGLEEIA